MVLVRGRVRIKIRIRVRVRVGGYIQRWGLPLEQLSPEQMSDIPYTSTLSVKRNLSLLQSDTR